MEGLFSKTLKTINDEEFVHNNRANQFAFTRYRKLNFKELIFILMSFSRPSVKTELDRFFKAISQFPNSFESVSKSAFTQARQKLKSEVFVHLGAEQLDYFTQNAPYKKTWNGYRLIAIDGSKMNLPYSKELKAEFGLMKNQYELEYVGALASIAYDVSNNLIIDATLAHSAGSEQQLAVEHLSKLNPQTDILIFDRGYPSVWLMSLLESRGFKFCMRLSSKWKDGISLKNSADNDINWSKSRDDNGGSKKRFKEFNIAHQLEARLVKIPLSSGEIEILATNLLDREKFSVEELKELYHCRWGVEVGVRVLKQVLEVEYFTGKSVHAVEQDFYARIFMANMASMIASQGLHEQKLKKERKCKHKLKVNITQALAKTKDFLLDLFYSLNPEKLIHQILKLLGKCFEIVRPNRSFQRKKKRNLRINKFMNYRGI